MSDQKSTQTITIKKYANRRLYNTATSTYVTLEDLSVMVKEGTKFSVYDAKSSEDITRSVLTQIIVEEENKTGQESLLPINFLRQLIGFYGNNMQWMVPKYLDHSMELLTGNQDHIKDYFKTTFGSIFPFGTTLEEMSKQNMSMFENTMRMFSPLSTFNFGLGDGITTTTTPVTSTTSTTTNTSCCTDTTPCCATDTKTTQKTNTCCATTKTETKKEETEKQTASITNLKPRTENDNKSTTTTPMPNVMTATATGTTGADDMQQKIANLQRQLADLAKSRA